MKTNPINFDQDQMMKDLNDLNEKMLKGIDILSELSEESITQGVSEKEAVYHDDKLTLYRYKSLVKNKISTPVLICYALVNRPYMADIQEDRSLIRSLLNLGIDIYLIDWGYPGLEDRWLTLDDYINEYIDGCVDYIRAEHNLDSINLLGICQGGTFSTCYTALHQEKIKNLITMVTPIDFHSEDGLLNMWAGCTVGIQALNVDNMVDAMGNISGDFMNLGYLMLKPFQLGVQKYLSLIDIMDDKNKLMNFLRMEKWIFDSPDQAGEAWRQFMKDFYQNNKLIKSELFIGEHKVELKNIKNPVLNILAEEDHLVPPHSTMALEKHISSEDYTLKSFKTGHIGIYVSGKVQKDLGPLISNWLNERNS